MNSSKIVMNDVRKRLNVKLTADEIDMICDKWIQKPMHEQFERETADKRCIGLWLGFKRGELKKETENLVVGAQKQALKTNYRKTKHKQDDRHKHANCANRKTKRFRT